MIVGLRERKISNYQFVNMIFINVHLNFVMKIKFKNEQSMSISFNDFFQSEHIEDYNFTIYYNLYQG